MLVIVLSAKENKLKYPTDSGGELAAKTSDTEGGTTEKKKKKKGESL